MPCEDGRTMEERLEKFIRDGKKCIQNEFIRIHA